MKKKFAILGITLTSFALATQHCIANIIDNTYGVGAGSFELGNFVDGGLGHMGLAPGAGTILGWTVGGPGDGVDWLTEPHYAAESGRHAVDLINTSAGSISTTIATDIGQVYDLTFFAAAIDTGSAQGLVSAGSLVNQTFFPPITTGRDFGNQAFAPFSFSFVATGATTTVTFRSANSGQSGCHPDCYGPVIDNVGVSLVPVPATLALFCIGLVWLPASNRKVRKRDQAQF